ncbi:hypothetical protein [Streptomyces sp. AC555_RSS877]|uniref:hypothetical protein n=1 Tax=Streptomyces sp. AC555_RSS877 TaxID=2823688 RepID=UPI001C274E29
MAKQLQEVQVERDELAIAERVLNRLAEQVQADAEAVAPVSAQVAGRTVLLIPHRSDAADEGALPGDYRRILAIVREADGPAQVRAVGEWLGLNTSVRGKHSRQRAKKAYTCGQGGNGRHRPPFDAVVDEIAHRVDQLPVAVDLRPPAPARQPSRTGSRSRTDAHFRHAW